VSIDSYRAVLLALGLCFVAGGWAQRNDATIAGAVCGVIAPPAWLVLLFRGITMGAGSIVWLRPITLFAIFAAMAPLMGVASGWAMSWSKRRSVREAV
jgi:hypothetical protein